MLRFFLKKLILFLFLCLFLFLFLHSKEVEATPNWVKNPPIENSQYRFYVGRASGKETDSQRTLVKIAIKDAREAAISENFGVFTSISKESYQTMDSTSVVSRVSEFSKNVILKKFIKRKQYIESKYGKQNIYLLFQYPKHEILLETQRLEKADSSKPPIRFSEISGTNSATGGFLEVSTSPLGASISVDGQSYGISPAKIRLEQGPHVVVLDHSHFNHIEEKVIIENDGVSKMNKVMVRSQREVYIETQPKGASVELAGKYLGLSPVETIVPTGEKLGLLINHQEAEIYRSNIEVGKGEGAYIIKVPPLILKPSSFSVNSIPQGAEVYFDNKFVGKTPTGFLEGKPKGFIRIVKTGYVEHTSTLRLKGGERHPLPVITLIPKIRTEGFKGSVYDSELLRMAIEVGNMNLVSMLIKKGGININRRYKDGKTLLGLAIDNNYIDIISLLIENGADVNVKNKEGKTLLGLAIDKNDIGIISLDNNYMDIISLLIENGANVNVKNKDGKTLLNLAIDKNNIDIISLLMGNGANVNLNDENNSPLFHRVVNGHHCNQELSSLFVKHSVDVNVKDPGDGKTILHIIANTRRPLFKSNESLSNCLEVVSFLIEHGADIDAKDKYGKVPLDYVVSKRTQWTSIFLHEKLRKSCENKRGSSCFNLGVIAEKKGHITQATELFEKACIGGEVLGCSKMGLIEEEMGNFSQAAKFFDKSCKGGKIKDCFKLGVIKKKMGKRYQAAKLFGKSCEGGEVSGCFELGTIKKTKKKFTQAAKFFDKACKGGKIDGCSELEMVERKIASEKKARVAKIRMSSILKDSFSVRLIQTGKPKVNVDFKSVTFGKRDATEFVNDREFDFQSTLGLSVGYTNFIGNKFFDVGLDIVSASRSAESRGLSIQPITLFTNVGWANWLSGQACIKIFGGIGLSHLGINAKGISSESSPWVSTSNRYWPD